MKKLGLLLLTSMMMLSCSKDKECFEEKITYEPKYVDKFICENRFGSSSPHCYTKSFLVYDTIITLIPCKKNK